MAHGLYGLRWPLCAACRHLVAASCDILQALKLLRCSPRQGRAHSLTQNLSAKSLCLVAQVRAETPVSPMTTELQRSSTPKACRTADLIPAESDKLQAAGKQSISGQCQCYRCSGSQQSQPVLPRGPNACQLAPVVNPASSNWAAASPDTLPMLPHGSNCESSRGPS